MNDDINDDIDALIDELNAAGGSVRNSPRALRMETMLRDVVSRRGSDLLLVAGSPPAVRVDGQVVSLEGAVLEGGDIEEVVLPLLPSYAAKHYQQTGVADASLRFPEIGRFRVNIHRERGRAAAATARSPRKSRN